MPEDKLILLHNKLQEKGLYTKSYNEFRDQFSMPEKQMALYQKLNEKGLYTKSHEDFQTQFFGLKKKEPTSQDSTLPSQNGGQEQELSTTGSTESSSLPGLETPLNEIPIIDEQQGLTAEQQYNAAREDGIIKDSTERGALTALPDALIKFVGYDLPATGAGAVATAADLLENAVKSPELIPGIRETLNSGAYLNKRANKEMEGIFHQLEKYSKGLSDGKISEEEYAEFLTKAKVRVDALSQGGFLDKKEVEPIDEFKASVVDWAIEHQSKGDYLTEGHTQSFRDINDIESGLDYVLSTVGESIGQIPLAFVTGGGSSMMQETGSIYMDSVKKIAEEKGITPREVIEQGMDDGATSLSFGVAAGLLDRIGAGSVLKSFGKKAFKKELQKRALQTLESGVTEGLTEAAQTIIEEVGANNISGKDWNNIEWENVAEAAVKGTIGGGALSSVGSVSNQEEVSVQPKEETKTEPVEFGEDQTSFEETPLPETEDANVDYEQKFTEDLVKDHPNVKTTINEAEDDQGNKVKEIEIDTEAMSDEEYQSLIKKIEEESVVGEIITDGYDLDSPIGKIGDGGINEVQTKLEFEKELTEDEINTLKEIADEESSIGAFTVSEDKKTILFTPNDGTNLEDYGRKATEFAKAADLQGISGILTEGGGTKRSKIQTEPTNQEQENQNQAQEEVTTALSKEQSTAENVEQPVQETRTEETGEQEGRLSEPTPDKGEKQHLYIKRALSDPRNDDKYKSIVEKEGTYTAKSFQDANVLADNVIKQTEKELGDQALTELSREIQDGRVKMEPMVRRIAADKVVYQLNKQKRYDEAAELSKWIAERGEESAKFMVAGRSDASPEALVSSVFEEYYNKKSDTLSEVLGEDYNKVIKDFKSRIESLEQKYDDLKKNARPSYSRGEQTIANAKKKRQEALGRIAQKLEDKFTKKAIDDSPLNDTSILQDVIDVFDSFLMEFAGNVEKSFSKLKSTLKDHIDPKQLEKYKRQILDGAQLTEDQYNQALKAEKDKLISDELSKVLKTKKKSVRELLDGDVRSLSNEEFSNKITEALGVEQLDQTTIDKLDKMLQDIQNAPEGEQKLEASEKLITEVAKIRGVNKLDVAMSLWYANLLSGPSTQALNTFANLAETISEHYVSSIQSLTKKEGSVSDRLAGISFITKSLLRGYKRGFYDFMRTMSTGYSPARLKNKIDLPDTLEYTKAGKIHKYVPRLMKATDTFFYRGLEEMRSAQLAWGNALREGKNKPTKEIWGEATEMLYATKDRVKEAKSKAISEGLTEGSKKFKRRVFEIMEQSRPEEMTHEAADFASRGTFNYDTEGTLGLFEKQLSGFLNQAKFFKLLIPFTRVITNVANRYLDWNPIVGGMRAAKGGIGFGKYARKYTPEERQRQIVKASTGLAVSTLLYALSEPGDDDEPLVEITADGTGDYKKNYQLGQSGWEPYSLKINGTWYSYKYTPIAIPLATIGFIRDREKYHGEESTSAKAQLALSATFKYTADMTALQGVSNVMDLANSQSITGDKGSLKKVGKIGSKFGKSAVVPNLFTQVSRLYQELGDIPMKKADNMLEDMVRDMPVARDGLNNIYNALGEPVSPEIGKRFYPLSVAEHNRKGSKAWDLIVDNQAWISTPNKNKIFYVPDENIERPMTDDEYNKFLLERGKILRKYLEENYNYIKSLSKEDAQKDIKRYDTFAKQEAEWEVLK